MDEMNELNDPMLGRLTKQGDRSIREAGFKRKENKWINFFECKNNLVSAEGERKMESELVDRDHGHTNGRSRWNWNNEVASQLLPCTSFWRR